MKYLALMITFILSVSFQSAFGGEPVLTIETETEKVSFKRSELLKRKDLEEVVIKKDPAYPGGQRKYKAIKVIHLFKNIKHSEAAIVLFKATDGFSAPLSKARLLANSPKESMAYLAIEPAEKKWPSLKKGGLSAGPFYLVWKNPKFSQIGQ